MTTALADPGRRPDYQTAKLLLKNYEPAERSVQDDASRIRTGLPSWNSA